MITVEVTNRHASRNTDSARLREAAVSVLRGEGIASASLSLAVVDDATSHQLNRRYLDHDYPTDVLSFPLEVGEDHLEGEVVISADTADRLAARYGWSAEDELLLYVVHGVLHLAGYQDRSQDERDCMRRRETFYLRQFGLTPPWETADDRPPD